MIPNAELPEGYWVSAGSDPDHENLTVEVHGPDGIVAVLSFEPGDSDVVVTWPVDPGWERARSGRLGQIVDALQYARSYLLSFKPIQNA